MGQRTEQLRYIRLFCVIFPAKAKKTSLSLNKSIATPFFFNELRQIPSTHKGTKKQLKFTACSSKIAYEMLGHRKPQHAIYQPRECFLNEKCMNRNGDTDGVDVYFTL